MYKVFYNNSAIFIGDKLTIGEINLKLAKVSNRKEVFLFLGEFVANENSENYYLSGYDEHDLFGDLKSFFQFVEAAGGLVKNTLQEYLFIFRFGIWDLPKGKMKKHEIPKNAAIREVEEETGVSGLAVTAKLSSTYHIYKFNKTFVLKKTYWFSMFTKDCGKLIPQQEEDITEAVWLDRTKSRDAIQSSYRSLKENFSSFFQD